MNFNYTLVIFFLLTFTACGGDSGGSNSSPDSDPSQSDNQDNNQDADLVTNPDDTPNPVAHFSGEDCMSCHVAGGDGESAGIFSVAGTVFGGNATINLYVVDSSERLISVTTDANGNFYSTAEIPQLITGVGNKGNFVDGVDAEVVYSSGLRQTMPGSPTNGSCNGCHFNGSGGNGRL